MLNSIARVIRRTLLYGLSVSILLGITMAVVVLENRSDLSIWHQVRLDQEFTAESKAETFADYLAIEEQVFAQLDERVYAHTSTGAEQRVNRYSRNSLADPIQWPRNWNRSYELDSHEPKVGVLLLHGMSDSPYSLRTLGQKLNDNGAQVLGLRYPGHGTAPSGLTTLRWEDMARAVELAMRHLKQQVGDHPIYIVGYSAGGALAVNYALQSLSDSERPKATGLILVSPAIGVSSLAPFAVWQARLGALLRLDKLEWADIKPEYDPFKYNSFAVNAGDQVYRLTLEISRLIAHYSKSGDLENLPPMLAFQSSVDATVSTRALIDSLFEKLPANGNHLVLFDINRLTGIEPLLKQDPAHTFARFLQQKTLPFTLSIVANSQRGDREAVIRTRLQNQPNINISDTGIQWPREVYSLSHIALPFAKNDPLYGPNGQPPENAIKLGDFRSRGERGVLLVPAADMLRLRWNPFYPLIEDAAIKFTGLE